jgi:hypothetical protein
MRYSFPKRGAGFIERDFYIALKLATKKVNLKAILRIV